MIAGSKGGSQRFWAERSRSGGERSRYEEEHPGFRPDGRCRAVASPGDPGSSRLDVGATSRASGRRPTEAVSIVTFWPCRRPAPERAAVVAVLCVLWAGVPHAAVHNTHGLSLHLLFRSRPVPLDVPERRYLVQRRMAPFTIVVLRSLVQHRPQILQRPRLREQRLSLCLEPSASSAQ